MAQPKIGPHTKGMHANNMRSDASTMPGNESWTHRNCSSLEEEEEEEEENGRREEKGEEGKTCFFFFFLSGWGDDASATEASRRCATADVRMLAS